MTIEEKKKKVEEFLGQQDNNQVEPTEVSNDVEEKDTIPAPFAGRYKSDTGLFSGGFEGEVELPEAPAVEPTPAPAPTPSPIPPPEPPYDVGELLAIQIVNQGTFIGNQNRIIEGQDKIIENQERDRIEYERLNVLSFDNPVYDFAESTIDSGYQVTFTLVVPEGKALFLEYFCITYAPDTIYGLVIDGVGSTTYPLITEPILDYANHQTFFRPPRICYSSVIVTATNLQAVAQTFNIFIRGFFRDTQRLNPEYLGSR